MGRPRHGGLLCQSEDYGQVAAMLEQIGLRKGRGARSRLAAAQSIPANTSASSSAIVASPEREVRILLELAIVDLGRTAQHFDRQPILLDLAPVRISLVGRGEDACAETWTRPRR